MSSVFSVFLCRHCCAAGDGIKTGMLFPLDLKSIKQNHPKEDVVLKLNLFFDGFQERVYFSRMIVSCASDSKV